MSDDLAATLAGIRERSEGPMRKFGDVDASQRDIAPLLAAVEAALELTVEWKQIPFAVRASDECADELRETITAALAGEEAGDG